MRGRSLYPRAPSVVDLDGPEREVHPVALAQVPLDVLLARPAGDRVVVHVGELLLQLAVDVPDIRQLRSLGQPFDRFVQARILDPLGMVDTGWVVPEKEVMTSLQWGWVLWLFAVNAIAVFLFGIAPIIVWIWFAIREVARWG